MQKKIDLKKIRKYIIAGIVIIIIIVVARLSCSSDHQVQYTFSKVEEGEVLKTISASGVLEFDNTVNVLSKENGIIDTVKVKLNQVVTKGMVLALLDSSSIEQERLKAAAALEGARVELVSAQKELNNNRSMFKDNLISKQAMENSEFNYKRVLAKYKQYKIDYTRIVQQRKNTIIRSPIHGIVYQINASDNSPTKFGSHLFTITPDLKKMNLAINIDESDIGYIKKGLTVDFTVSAYPQQVFSGTIKEVHMNPLKRGNIVFYRSIVACSNKDLLLKPGMTATAIVVISKKENVLRVLNQAFSVNPEGTTLDVTAKEKYLWMKVKSLVKADEIKKVKVKTGLEGNLYTEIVSGVKKGDLILKSVNEISD